jgi:hypothetical protein
MLLRGFAKSLGEARIVIAPSVRKGRDHLLAPTANIDFLTGFFPPRKLTANASFPPFLQLRGSVFKHSR